MTAPFDAYYTWLAIPPEEQPPDHYRLLGLRRFEANAEVITNAVDQRMAHIRTFQAGRHVAESQTLLNELAQAGRCLLDDQRRLAYDNQLKTRLQPASPAQPAQPAQPASAPGGEGQAVPVEIFPAAAAAPAAPAAPVPWNVGPPGRAASARRGATTPGKTIRPGWQQPAVIGTVSVAAVLGLVALLAATRSPQGDQAGTPKTPPIRRSTIQTIPSTIPSAPGSPLAESPLAESPQVTSPQARNPQAIPTPVPLNPAAPTTPPLPSPVAPLPQGAPPYAVALAASGMQLLKTRDLIQMNRPFTVECWAAPPPRGDLELSGGVLLGNCLLGNLEQPTAGWQLWLSSNSGSLQCSFATGTGFRTTVRPSPVSSTPWRHFAVASDGRQTRMFVDGRLATQQPAQVLMESERRSPIDLHVGGHEFLHPQQPRGWQGMLGGLRISQVARYASDFAPEGQWAPDTDTLVLLDFQHPVAGAIRDLSGRGHDGDLKRCRWVAGVAALPSAAQFAAALPANTVASAPPEPTTPEPTTPGAATPGTTTPGANPESPIPTDVVLKSAPTGRAAPPSEAEQKQGGQRVADVFRKELAALNGRDLAEVQALMDKLLQLARVTSESAPVRWALFHQAFQLAAEHKGLSAALPIVDELEGHFDYDGSDLRMAALRDAADKARTPAQRRNFIEMALQVASAVTRSERFDLALDAARMALGQASRLGDNDLKRQARDARSATEIGRRQWEAADRARQKLAAADGQTEEELAAARTVWGRYLATVRGDWPTAIELLTQCGDEPLRGAAAADARLAQSPSDAASPQQWLQVGNLWWDLGTSGGDGVAAFRQRACFWYHRALPGLEGLDRFRVEERLTKHSAESADSTLAAAVIQQAETQNPVLPPQVPGQFKGMVGRLTADGADAQVALFYHAGTRFSNQSLRATLDQLPLAPKQLQINFTGSLLVSQAGVVVFAVKGGSPTGAARIWVDGKIAGDLGNSNATPKPLEGAFRLALSPGEHQIQWAVSGADIGLCQLLVVDPAGRSQALYHNPMMLAAVKARPTKVLLHIE